MACFSATMRHASSALLLALLCLPLKIGANECKGTVFLTFDTGNMEQAEFIARTLKERNIRATFFLANTPTRRGDHALDKTWRDYWRARVSEGHVFGNHTWSHHYARKDIPDGRLQASDRNGKQVILDNKQYCNELARVEKQFQQLTGKTINAIWRAPGGRTTQQSLRWASDCGYPLHVGWDPAGYIGDDLPSDRYSNEALLNKALKNIKGGDIILMHLGIWSRKTPLAPVLPQLIDGLQQRGFCFDVIRGGQR